MDDLGALNRRDVRVQIADLDADFREVVGQVLRHLLRQCRDEHALVALDADLDLGEQVVDLALERPDLDLRVEEARRANDLLRDLLGLLELVLARRRRDVDDLVDARGELLEGQRAVVEGRRQPEAVLDERDLAAAVAGVHRVELRQRHMRLIHDDQEVFGKVVEQRVRRLAGLAVRQVARVVLDARAVAHLLHHLEVVARALLDALRLDELALRLELLDLLLHLRLDVLHRDLEVFVLRDVMRGREDHRVRALAVDLPRHDVELDDAVDLVAEELDAHGAVVVAGREDLDDIAAHAELTTLERDIVALVADGDELLEDCVSIDNLPLVQREHHLVVALRRTQAVDAGDGRDDDDVAPLKQRARRAVAQLIDLVIDRSILLDVGVRRGDVGLRLVEVVVADEVADVVVREERLELTRELRRQRLVVGDDERRLLHLLDDLGDRVRLARARRAQEDLRLLAVLDAGRELLDGLRLVAHRLKWRHDLKRPLFVKMHRIEFRHHGHANPLPYPYH